jgi:DNA-binding NarL/FixJ family response regulator
MASIKTAIVEDSDEIRESLSILINGSEGLECRYTYKTSEQALKDLPDKDINVVLMDINLPGMNGIECTQKLKIKMPNTQIIMLTVYEDPDNIFESLKAGASGYLLKRTAPLKILEAIEEVSKGGSPMSNQIARRVVQSFQSSEANVNSEIKLSKREMEILGGLSKGYRYKEIAESLFISIDTVRSHVRNIYEKLHVRSRTEAVLKYFKK